MLLFIAQFEELKKSYISLNIKLEQKSYGTLVKIPLDLSCNTCLKIKLLNETVIFVYEEQILIWNK